MSNNAARREILGELIEASGKRLAELENSVTFEQRYLADLKERHGNISTTGPVKRRIIRTKPILTKGSIEPGSLTDQIVGVLKDSGETMRASNIARELTKRGATTTAKGGMLPMVISSLSRRKNLFHKVARGQYKLIQSREPTN